MNRIFSNLPQFLKDNNLIDDIDSLKGKGIAIHIVSDADDMEKIEDMLRSKLKAHLDESSGEHKIEIPFENDEKNSCESCGFSLQSLYAHQQVGCSHCYIQFENEIAVLVEHLHGMANHHIGKIPKNMIAKELNQLMLTRLRRRLDDAVAYEDYELAAQLRDEISLIDN